MKLKEITNEQRERIEKNNIGKLVIYFIENMINPEIHLQYTHGEIKRTIKRIEDEIEFIQDAKNGDGWYAHKLSHRFRILLQELEDYKLMETLE